VRYQTAQRAARSGRVAVGVAALASAAALMTGSADAASTASTVSAPDMVAAGRPASGAVFLLNGDRVVAAPGPGGRPASALDPVPGAGAVVTLALGQQRYDVPADALPYIGHGLNPSLFSLATLRTAESAGRLPVRLSYAGPRPALPGITITAAHGRTASGYLTAASARTFGAALARQFRADHGRASYGRDGMFASGTSISVAGAGTWPTQARPDFPMHTLTVRATNLKGRPDNGDVVEVFNAANWHTFGDPDESESTFYHGAAKFSVPAGPYWAIGFFGPGLTRLVVAPQFSVTGQKTTLSLAASSAMKVTMKTPRPSALETSSVLVVRGGQHGTSESAGMFGFPGVWLSPTRTRPTVGTLRSYTTAQEASPTGARGTRYEYLLAPASPPGLIPDQRWVIRPASLATVTDRFYQARPGAWSLFTFGGSLPQFGGGVGSRLLPLRLPGTLTQYVTGGPSVAWRNQLRPGGVLSFPVESGLLQARPGARLTDDWGQYPLHPQPDAQPLAGAAARTLPEAPSAYRMGNELVLTTTPFSDNTAGHLGLAFDHEQGANGRYAVYQNGTEIAHGNPFTPAGPHSRGGLASGAGVPVRLTARPSAIRLVLTASRKVAPPLSGSTTTVWTWQSRRDPGGRVPAGWYCQATEFGPRVRTCAVQPMLALDYHVRGMALDGSTPPGPQLIRLDVGHIQPGGRARIADVTVRVSANGGRTWRRARVTGSGGRFVVRFTPPAGRDVTLRVAARDAGGGSITETVRDSYRVRAHAGASPSDPAPRRACGSARPGQARCYVIYQPRHVAASAGAAGWAGPALASARPTGLGATQLEQAYRLPVARGAGQTVAVSIAYNTPHLAAYLARYRAWYHLPACTTASGCLRIVNQHGRPAPLPASSARTGWDVEATLDVSMISAACPHCRILVVEGNSDSFADLAATENTAARLGAQVISNSYGAREFGGNLAEAPAYRHPGHTIVVASGDDGYTAANFPADLSTVTAAGGTELTRAHDTRGWAERTWFSQIGASGSACSAYVAKPAWQHDPHCPGRTVADVSAAAADISIYDPVYGGWLNVGGTSAAAPLIAGIYGLAGNAATITPGYEYAHRHDLFDITKGTNSGFVSARQACGDDYLCVAKRGYDGPTGLGSPDGTGAF
jgi:Subtilase family